MGFTMLNIVVFRNKISPWRLWRGYIYSLLCGHVMMSEMFTLHLKLHTFYNTLQNYMYDGSFMDSK